MRTSRWIAPLAALAIGVPAGAQQSTLVDRAERIHQRRMQQMMEHGPEPQVRSIDPAELQHQADELAALSQSVQAEMAAVRKGLLPKDLHEKLKQIEKLSKKLRGALNP